MKVLSTQGNSRTCIICGMENDSSVKARFYNLDDGSVATVFKFKSLHQSYPERTHGGMIGALLDEVMGRVIWHSADGVDDMSKFAVTISMTIKYRKPVPYDTLLKARGYYTKDTSRVYASKGEIFDMQGNLLAEAEATYMKMSPTAVVSGEYTMHDEMCYHYPADIEEIEFPEIVK